MIRNADWILDLGPEGGEDGGRVVGEGRPAKIAATPGSYTGQFLTALLHLQPTAGWKRELGRMYYAGAGRSSRNLDPGLPFDRSESAEATHPKHIAGDKAITKQSTPEERRRDASMNRLPEHEPENEPKTSPRQDTRTHRQSSGEAGSHASASEPEMSGTSTGPWRPPPSIEDPE